MARDRDRPAACACFVFVKRTMPLIGQAQSRVMVTLRQRLTERFADMLPDQDE